MMQRAIVLCLVAVCLSIATTHGAGVRATSGFVSLVCAGTTCAECLASGCGWTPFYATNSGRCMTSCSVIADASCCSASSTSTPAQVCGEVDRVNVDQTICTAATNSGCGGCTSTVQSDGATACQWIKETQSCATYGSCNMMGCATAVCSASNSTTVQSKPTEKPLPSPTQSPAMAGAVEVPEPTMCSIGSCFRSWSRQESSNMPSLLLCVFDCILR